MKKFILICGLFMCIATRIFGQVVSNWGFNIHDGGNDPQIIADKMVERNFNCVRMDLWGNDPNYLTKFRNAVAILKAKKYQYRSGGLYNFFKWTITFARL